MWNKNRDNVKAIQSNNRVQSPSKFFVVNDLKRVAPIGSFDGSSLMRNSDTKIKNQIRLAMEVMKEKFIP